MEPIQIQQADVLDILFENRNKSYGAYELRKTYNRRLSKALMWTATCCIAMTGAYFVSGKFIKASHRPIPIGDEIEISSIKQEKEKPIEIPKPKLPQLATQMLVTPLITREPIKPEEEMPPVEDLENKKIGTQTLQGDLDIGIQAPVAQEGAAKGIIETPKKTEPETIFTKVEIESQYPGGSDAWVRFLLKNFRVPEDGSAVEGTVVVQFIVDKEGKVSDVHAVSGPESLYAEAERVIRKSGNWTVAIQNGQPVASYKKQPIVVKLDTQE